MSDYIYVLHDGVYLKLSWEVRIYLSIIHFMVTPIAAANRRWVLIPIINVAFDSRYRLSIYNTIHKFKYVQWEYAEFAHPMNAMKCRFKNA